MAIKCPHCQSENVQRYVMVYESGEAAGEAGVDLGSDCETEASQVELSQKTSPPRKFSYAMWFFFGCGVFMTLKFTTSLSPIIPYLTFVVIAGVGLYITIKFNFSKWPRLMEEWKKSFICLNCGRSFIVGDTDDTDHVDG